MKYFQSPLYTSGHPAPIRVSFSVFDISSTDAFRSTHSGSTNYNIHNRFFISTLSMETYGALEVEQLDMGRVEGCDALRSRITWMQKVPELESLRAALASLRVAVMCW